MGLASSDLPGGDGVADLIRAIGYVDAALQRFQLMDGDSFVQKVNGDLERAKVALRSQAEPQG